MKSKLAFWRNRSSDDTRTQAITQPTSPIPATVQTEVVTLDLDIAPNDPLLVYLTSASGPIEVDRIFLDSPATRALKATDVRLVLPLVSQGELIGLVNLSQRLSEQDYSSDDRKLLADLATQAAPAVRVAQLVQQQKLEAIERERIAQELRVARVIQQTLLPKELPEVAGWHVDALWQPAREVSGDFYDFIPLHDGRMGILIADVTDKGVPAALVMATARTILRAAAERLMSPGQVLERANNVLHPDIPPKMFVTCLYAVLDPATGHLQFANAGHNLPFVQSASAAKELRATGMPLGLLPGMTYEEKETVLGVGDRLLFYSDGLVEAHNPRREMFGTPHLHDLLCESAAEENLAGYLLAELADFTGQSWEQEDDVTFVVVKRLLPVRAGAEWRSLATFETASQPGNEREVSDRVVEVVQALGLPADRLERLKTATAEATMNAMEHGNKYDPDKPVRVEVRQSANQLAVVITDQGGGAPIHDDTEPDLEAKLAGLQSPRGWGLFLIKSMVDEMNIISDDRHHSLELIFNLQGADYASASS